MDRLPLPNVGPKQITMPKLAKLLRGFGAFIAVLPIFSMASVLSAGETETFYYVYHGQQKALQLDGQHITVRVSTPAPNVPSLPATLPTSLTTHGFTAEDIVAQPVPGWLILNA